MVQTESKANSPTGPVKICKTLDAIDINNYCRRAYLKKMESIEECRQSNRADSANGENSSISTALARLRNEMVGLMDQDAGLMRQMLILNEKVEELKSSNFSQMRKEPLLDSEEILCETDSSTSDDEEFNK